MVLLAALWKGTGRWLALASCIYYSHSRSSSESKRNSGSRIPQKAEEQERAGAGSSSWSCDLPACLQRGSILSIVCSSLSYQQSTWFPYRVLSLSLPLTPTFSLSSPLSCTKIISVGICHTCSLKKKNPTQHCNSTFFFFFGKKVGVVCVWEADMVFPLQPKLRHAYHQGERERQREEVLV